MRDRLTSSKVRSVTTPGMLPDGAGLYLLVSKPGRKGAIRKSWIYRYTRNGKTHEMGLGAYPTFSLGEARERANAQRQLLADGVDPLTTRRMAQLGNRQAETTFQKVAEDFLKTRKWKSELDYRIWPARFNTYVYPKIGQWPIVDIDTAAVLQVVEPLWLDKQETAERIRSKIENILDYATVKNLRIGDNPATKKLLAKVLANGATEKRHHAALPYAEVPGFVKALRERRGRTQRSQLTALSVEWLILTAARSGEVRGLASEEVDYDRRLWAIPAARMKAGREHVIPLPDRALEIWADILFGGPRSTTDDKVLLGASENAMLRLVRQLAGRRVTLHGFRSSFRDWCAETGVRRELAEAALAHSVGDKTEAAYNRTSLVEQRREVMEDWARYIYSQA